MDGTSNHNHRPRASTHQCLLSSLLERPDTSEVCHRTLQDIIASLTALAGTVLVTLQKTFPDYTFKALARTPSSLSSFPKPVEPVQGTFADTALITQHASQADVVVAAGDSDDVALKDAVLGGLKQRYEAGKGLGALVWTSGTAVYWDGGKEGKYDPKGKVWTVRDIRSCAHMRVFIERAPRTTRKTSARSMRRWSTVPSTSRTYQAALTDPFRRLTSFCIPASSKPNKKDTSTHTSSRPPSCTAPARHPPSVRASSSSTSSGTPSQRSASRTSARVATSPALYALPHPPSIFLIYKRILQVYVNDLAALFTLVVKKLAAAGGKRLPESPYTRYVIACAEPRLAFKDVVSWIGAELHGRGKIPRAEPLRLKVEDAGPVLGLCVFLLDSSCRERELRFVWIVSARRIRSWSRSARRSWGGCRQGRR